MYPESFRSQYGPGVGLGRLGFLERWPFSGLLYDLRAQIGLVRVCCEL